MDDVLASRFGKTRARRWFWNQKMRRTRREHKWCCPRVMRWSGEVSQGYHGMLQEPRIEEKSRVTLTGFAGFSGIRHGSVDRSGYLGQPREPG
jgi:hypothetical protein